MSAQTVSGSFPPIVSSAFGSRVPELLWTLALVLVASSAWSQGATDLLAASPTIVVASSPSSSGAPIGFGASLALDQDLLVVGAPDEGLSTDPNVGDVGAVYVYERDGNDWILDQKLRADVELPNELFGASVAVARGYDTDGPIDYLVVGAPGYQSGSGRIYLFFRRPGTDWALETAFVEDAPAAGERFGQGVAIDFFLPPNALPPLVPHFFFAVGAPFDRDPGDPGNSQHGSLSVFQRTGGPPTWGLGPLPFYGEHNDQLGSAVAMSYTDIIAAGAGIAEPPDFLFGGAQLIRQANQLPAGDFVYNLQWELIPSNAAGFADIGASAALDGATIAALGAPLDDEVGFNAGKVYVFDIGGGQGTLRNEVAILTPPELTASSQFGTAVAISGTLIAASAPGLSDTGMIFLFEQGATTSDWTQVGFLSPPSINPPNGCIEGAAIAVQLPRAAVGCPGRLTFNDGGALVYQSGLFLDGFETGDTTAWSATQP